jgi:serine/threonine protein kinase
MYQPGMPLGSRYIVEKHAGSGHFAEVYLAWDRQAGKMVALKIARSSYGNPEKENLFSKEAGRLFILQHPHIVRLLDYTILDHKPTLVMEYLPHTLRERYRPDRKRQRPLPAEEMRQYLQQAASALEYAHNNRIFHRDIKPENILLDNNGLLKVSDFGISVFLPELIRQKGTGGGTWGYEAPEGYPGPHADQYSLGVVVYEGLVGHRPGPWKALHYLTSHLFPTSPVAALLPVVIQALARDPGKRFQSVRDFSAAFEQAYIQAQARSYKPLRQVLIPGFIVCLLVLASISIPLLSLIHTSQKAVPTRVAQIKTATPDLTSTAIVGNQVYQQATSGTPSFNSSLASQDSNKWQVTRGAASSCSFTKGVYQVSSQQNGTLMSCLEQAKTFKDFAFQVDLTIASTNGDYGGIIVRATRNISYYFLIGIDESYKFNVTNKVDALTHGSSSAIYTSSNQWNQITVIAQGAEFFLYINRHFLAEVSDSSSLQGVVGLSAEDDFHPTQVKFRNARLWQLP